MVLLLCLKPCVLVMLTNVSCYNNLKTRWLYRVSVFTCSHKDRYGCPWVGRSPEASPPGSKVRHPASLASAILEPLTFSCFQCLPISLSIKIKLFRVSHKALCDITTPYLSNLVFHYSLSIFSLTLLQRHWPPTLGPSHTHATYQLDHLPHSVKSLLPLPLLNDPELGHPINVAILPTLPQHSSSPSPSLTYLCTFKYIIKI